MLVTGKTHWFVLQKDDYWMVIGECYVHGLMHGKAIAMMRRGELAVETTDY